MQVLPIFPLYPNSKFLKYNVSLAVPGPFLYDIPAIGKFAEKMGYPNSKTSVLLPDIEYIKKFASYDMGIADSLLKIGQQQNLARIKKPSGSGKEIFDIFNFNFTANTQDGMGFKSLEKTILASIFESQKPYFEIAQIAIKSIVVIEDIIARIAPIFGASINPTMAKSIKSRKPKGNGPFKTGNNPLGVGKYGSPVALGYKNAQEIKNNLNKLKTLSNKGNKVEVNSNGEATITQPIIATQSLVDSNLSYRYIYATVSTVYSTGQFDKNVKYEYHYIDIEDDIDPIDSPLDPEPIIEDLSPDRIILGFFDSTGSTIDPKSKIKFWGVDQVGNLEKQDSIFEKANWLYNSEKWIFSKSIDYPNSYSWQTLSEDNYHWGRYFSPGVILPGLYTDQIIIQKNSPGVDWYRLKYGDVIDFSQEENQLYDFKKDDYIISFNQSSISDYNNFYNSIVDSAISEKNINSTDANLIKTNVASLYNNQKINEQLQNLSKFGLLKDSYYTKIEDIDWNVYHTDPAPLQTFPNDIRQVFKPMRFNINNKEVWIDPETQYDIKVIRIDSTKKVDYKISNSVNSINIGTFSKNSEIKEFIKNNFEIGVSELSISTNFNIQVYKNSFLSDSQTNISLYNLYNWNYEFDNSSNSYNKLDTNTYDIILYYDYNKIPNIFLNYIEKGPNSQYSENRTLLNWAIQSFDLDSFEEVPYVIINSTGYSYFKKIKYEYYTDRVINPATFSATTEVTGILSNKLKISWQTSQTSTGYVVHYREIGQTWKKKIIQTNEGDVEIGGIGFDPTLNYEIYVQSIEDHKRHIRNIISVPDDTYQLEGFKLEVISDTIQKWIFLHDNFSQTTLPHFFTKNRLDINILNNGITYLQNPSTSNIITSYQTSIIGKFSVKIDGEDSIIDSSNILNKNLEFLGKIDNQYSSGKYSDGYQGGVVRDENGNEVKDENGNTIIEPDSPMFVGYTMRNQLTELDDESYFIIEGIRRDKNEDKNKDPEDVLLDGNTPQPTSSGGGYYKIRDAIGITPELIKMIVSISTDLIPAISKLISLIKNPASFVTEIIKLKSEKFFTILNPKVTNLISELPNLSQRVKSSNNEDKKDRVKEMRDKIKKTEMSNYIYVSDSGDFKFLLDGTALIGFFGILFGIKLDITHSFNGGVPIKPIFQINQLSGNLEFLLKNLNIKKDITNSEFIGTDFPEKDKNLLSHIDFSKEDKFIKNQIISSSGGIQYYEDVSIQYSTGEFVEGVNYKYIYITQEIEKIIAEADSFIDKNSNIDYDVNLDSVLDDFDSAISKYEEAYDLVNKIDKDNNSLKKLLLNKIKELKSKINSLSQPIMKMLLGIVTLPLKIIFEIIKWLLDFFKSLTDPTKIPDQMKEFLSFKWILKFFSPKGILEMAGIKFNPEKISEWCKASKAKNPLFGTIPGVSEYLIPDDYEISDLNDFLSIAFGAKLPIYTARQYRELCLKPMRLFSSFLCFFERVINSFIMLIWSIMGITAVIPPPLIKLCKKLNENIEEKDFNDILNGLFKDDTYSVDNNDNSGDGSSYEFLYDIKLPDGSIKRNLDRNAIKDFIDKNKDIDFDYLNFETIE